MVGAPTLVIALRVAFMARALADGWPRALILQVVAKAQTEEATKRKQYRLAAPDADAFEIAANIPLLWGDKPIPERTVDYYLTAARRQLARDAAQAAARPQEAHGEAFARIQTVYQKAIAAGKLGTALRASEALQSNALRYPTLNARRLSFVRWVVKGKEPTQAYTIVFPTAKVEHASSAASRLMALPAIRQAVAELRARATDNAAVTLEGHLHELAEIRDQARAAGNLAAAAAAEVARGKASGFYVEQMRVLPSVAGVETSVDVDAMSTAQLEELDRLLQPHRRPALPPGAPIAIVQAPTPPPTTNGNNGAHSSD